MDSKTEIFEKASIPKAVVDVVVLIFRKKG